MSGASSFDVQRWLAEAGRGCAPFAVSRPKQVSCWTKTSAKRGGEYLFEDTSGLLQFRSPDLPADLNEGYPEAFVRKPDDDAAPVELIVASARCSCVDVPRMHVVTFRNNLNKICLTPISPKNRWVVDACLVGDTLFLDIVKTPDGGDGPAQDRFMYYGYKFEALSTQPLDEDEQPDGADEGLVDSTSEFAGVFALQLGPLRVLMAAELDCCEPSGSDGGRVQYVELKTYKKPAHQKQEAVLYGSKYARWWVQSFLAGVPSIVLGARDDGGQLLAVSRLDVQTLPSTARRRGAAWDPWVLLGFSRDLLTWMRQQAATQPDAQLRFEYAGAGRVACIEVADGDLPERVQAALRGDE